MTPSRSPGAAVAVPAPEAGHHRAGRRRYDSRLRKEQAAQTRRRIVLAGSELLHGSDVRHWEGLTIRAVAERAGVSERTVYRHFTNERGLRDTVMGRLEEEAGIELEGMRLQDVAVMAARIFRHVSSFPLAPRPALDPTLSSANQRQHTALLAALGEEAPHWSDHQRTMAAAMLDLLWSVGAYERLVREWQLDPKAAAEAIGWVIAMVEAAVCSDRPPATRH